MREAIKEAFVPAWNAATSDVPLALDNETMPTVDVWAALTITTTTSDQVTAGEPGNRLVARRGWAVVKIGVLVNTGDALLNQLCQAVRDILEMKLIPSPIAGDEPIDTFAASTQSGGVDGRWYFQLVRTPFRWFETV